MKTEGFIYETHLHTKEASGCARNTGEEMARAYAAHGYTGIIVTDHFFHGNSALDRKLPWHEWVERFCLGYEHAKAEGDKLGLQVFFGWEANWRGHEFLTYGLDKEWLVKHPEIRDATVKEQFQLVHEGGGIISHAHPFRQEPGVPPVELYPEYVDAVEGVNAAHTTSGHPEFNEKAIAYAKKYNLPLTGGSDQHNSTELIYGGMVFARKLQDIHDFNRAVMNREALQLLEGGETID